MEANNTPQLIEAESESYAWGVCLWQYAETWQPIPNGNMAFGRWHRSRGAYDGLVDGPESIGYYADGVMVGRLRIVGNRVHDLAVIPPYQGKGIGRTLLLAAAKRGVRMECSSKTITRAGLACLNSVKSAK